MRPSIVPAVCRWEVAWSRAAKLGRGLRPAPADARPDVQSIPRVSRFVPSVAEDRPGFAGLSVAIWAVRASYGVMREKVGDGRVSRVPISFPPGVAISRTPRFGARAQNSEQISAISR